MPTKTILVAGGAGYIGSHMLLLLRQAGYTPVVIDNLSKGHRDAVGEMELIVGDIRDEAVLKNIFASREISAVMHLASLIEVAESVTKPELYYDNNVAGLIQLLRAMTDAGVRHFIYSSSAAVYGEPQAQRIHEAHPLQPVNPYGRSKKMAEDIIQDFAAAGKLDYAILRYFNAAGADPDGRAGERHVPESHLIPLCLQAATGKIPHVKIYGEDYPTADGTCIRDYVHVSDICNAHLLALLKLQKKAGNLIVNLGTGQGYSVRQVIKAVMRVTGQSVATMQAEKRSGDPAMLVANADLVKEKLNWVPRYPDLDTIILHAWQYMQKNSQ